MDLTTLEPAIHSAIAAIAVAVVAWVASHVVKLVPALASVITASRVTQAENALSNAAISALDGVLAGTVTKASVQAAVASKLNTLSVAARLAMSAQGTTEDMMVARTVGNALVKLGTAAPTSVIPNSTPIAKAQ
jgi:hypothetical protein